MMNALSPGPYLYWSLVTGPILLAGWRKAPVNGIGFLVSFYATIILSLIAIIVVFERHDGLDRGQSVFVGVSAIALASFGLYQLSLDWEQINPDRKTPTF